MLLLADNANTVLSYKYLLIFMKEFNLSDPVAVLESPEADGCHAH